MKDLFLTNTQLFVSKTSIDGLESCGLLVDYCDVYNPLIWLSFWRHPFTAENPFLSKWFNSKFVQIKLINSLCLNGTKWNIYTFIIKSNYEVWAGVSRCLSGSIYIKYYIYIYIYIYIYVYKLCLTFRQIKEGSFEETFFMQAIIAVHLQPVLEQA